MYDSYNMVFTDEAAYDTWEDANIIVHEPPDPGEIVGEHKLWVQAVVKIGQVLDEYFTGIPPVDPENPDYHVGYFVVVMTAGRKAVCQAEVVDPYPLTQFHMFQGGEFFQNQWKKNDL